MKNIILIGMPGSGKSTLGVLLAKIAGFSFLDSDLLIQSKVGKKLYRILEEDGADYFKSVENDVNSQIDVTDTVIATGGSVVYGRKAMKHLHENGTVVYIRLPYAEIERRLSNLATRGVTLREGQTLYDLYQERIPLYETEADIVFDAAGMEIEKTVAAIARRIEVLGGGSYGG